MLGQVRQNMDHSYRRTGAAGSGCLRHGRSYKIAPTREKLNGPAPEVRRGTAPISERARRPDCVVLAEQAINDYLRNEIEALRAALERIGKAIDEEAAKGRGEDWSLMVGYVQACVEKLPGELEEWQKD